MGVVVAALVAAVAVWSHLPERSHPRSPSGQGIRRPRSSVRGTTWARRGRRSGVRLFPRHAPGGVRHRPGDRCPHTGRSSRRAGDRAVAVRRAGPRPLHPLHGAGGSPALPATARCCLPAEARSPPWSRCSPARARSWLASLSAASQRAVPPGVEPETGAASTGAAYLVPGHLRVLTRRRRVADDRAVSRRRRLAAHREWTPADQAAIAELEGSSSGMSVTSSPVRRRSPCCGAGSGGRRRQHAGAQPDRPGMDVVCRHDRSARLVAQAVDRRSRLARTAQGGAGDAGGLDLADRIVDETLRLGQSEVLVRQVDAPVMIGEHGCHRAGT